MLFGVCPLQLRTYGLHYLCAMGRLHVDIPNEFKNGEHDICDKPTFFVGNPETMKRWVHSVDIYSKIVQDVVDMADRSGPDVVTCHKEKKDRQDREDIEDELQTCIHFLVPTDHYTGSSERTASSRD